MLSLAVSPKFICLPLSATRVILLPHHHLQMIFAIIFGVLFETLYREAEPFWDHHANVLANVANWTIITCAFALVVGESESLTFSTAV